MQRIHNDRGPPRKLCAGYSRLNGCAGDHAAHRPQEHRNISGVSFPGCGDKVLRLVPICSPGTPNTQQVGTRRRREAIQAFNKHIQRILPMTTFHQEGCQIT